MIFAFDYATRRCLPDAAFTPIFFLGPPPRAEAEFSFARQMLRCHATLPLSQRRDRHAVSPRHFVTPS